MRIGIDCRTILNPDGDSNAGIGHYVFFLVHALVRTRGRHEWVLFFSHDMKGKTAPFHKKNVTVAVLPKSGRLPVHHNHTKFARIVRKHHLDVFHGPANTLPLTYGGASVVTVHDLAIYEHPEWFPGGQSFSTKLVVPQSVKKARHIIAVSNSTKKAVVSRFAISEDKISVIYEGVAPVRRNGIARHSAWDDMVAKYDLEDHPFVLFVGTIEPRKNLVRLIKGFNRALRKYPRLRNHRLVLAGGKGWKYDRVMREVAQSKYGHRIKMVGYVSHADKVRLMRHAKLFAFPSLYEGFGLPVAEAMALGTPVMTSNVSSLPEVAGKAATFVTPESVTSIADGLARTLNSSARLKKLQTAGKRRAKKFTWEKAAAETLHIYKKVTQ